MRAKFFAHDKEYEITEIHFVLDKIKTKELKWRVGYVVAVRTWRTLILRYNTNIRKMQLINCQVIKLNP